MSETIHVLLSDAGEHEAGPTEFAERIVREELVAEKLFSEMEQACETFIERQIEIIESNEAMRKYNELTYGEVGGGYFYHLYWLAFPNPPDALEKIEAIVRHYICRSDMTLEGLCPFLRRQSGHDSDLDALEALAERFCDDS